MYAFNDLISSISQTHNCLQKQATSAVNQLLSIRNWLIGYYIVEYEQNGADRANYGEKLIPRIAESISHLKGIDERSLLRFRLFYLYYPQLAHVLSSKLEMLGIATTEVLPISLSEKSGTSPISSTDSISGTVSPKLENQKSYINGSLIISKLSYSHIEQLLKLEDVQKRTFYELECIKGTWSVRELKRQINSLYFERSGLSANPKKLSEQVQQQSQPSSPADIIKNIYTFDFLELPIKDIVEESDLEQALIVNLQEFILELGNGFCFEARQKRILIGTEYYFIDLVFYHRILKCHVLVELKIGAFEHGDIGQLNTYLNYYKSEIADACDNPPVGILLVADKEHALVKYATAGLEEQIFIQQYLIQLPDKQALEKRIEQEIKKHHFQQ